MNLKNNLLFVAMLMVSMQVVKAQERVSTKGQIPILAWYSIPASETTVARYQEMKDAGITLQFTGFPDIEAMQKALDVAEKVGMKMVVSCPELKTDPEKTARRFMNHPAVVGYHLIDEPSMASYPELGNWAKRIQAVDKNHFCYVNLFPIFADSSIMGTENYRQYVSECAKQIPLQFLSFDYYPVLKEKLSDRWFENLEVFSEEAKKAGKPFWAFALTTNYDEGHITPQTLAAMRLQVYANLAYGAQGIQYFTYWSATSLNTSSVEDQRGAPISAAGKRTVVYDRIKLMSQEIKNLSGLFLGSKVLWVRHMGKGKIPTGTVRLTSLPDAVKVLETNGKPAIVALLENGDNYILVVINKDFLNSIDLTFYGNETVKKVLKDGTIVPASVYENSLELDPGDAAIYTFPISKK